MALKIQVGGHGLIPRGFGLAPRKDLITADLLLIQTILSTNGLTLKWLSPEDGKLRPLRKDNCLRVWKKYGNWNPTVVSQEETVPEETPVDVPVNTPNNTPAEYIPVYKNDEVTPVTVVDTPTDTTNDKTDVILPDKVEEVKDEVVFTDPVVETPDTEKKDESTEETKTFKPIPNYNGKKHKK